MDKKTALYRPSAVFTISLHNKSTVSSQTRTALNTADLEFIGKELVQEAVGWRTGKNTPSNF